MQAMSAGSLVAVSSLREFFRDAFHAASEHQHLDIDESAEQYVVNLLTMFSRADALYEKDAGRAAHPALGAHAGRCPGSAEPDGAAARPAAAGRRLAVRGGILCAQLRAQIDRYRLSHRHGRERLQFAQRHHAALEFGPLRGRDLRAAGTEVSAAGRRPQRGQRHVLPAFRCRHPAPLRDMDRNRQSAGRMACCAASACSRSRAGRASRIDRHGIARAAVASRPALRRGHRLRRLRFPGHRPPRARGRRAG